VALAWLLALRERQLLALVVAVLAVSVSQD
jgi:hypothetical protein